MSGDVTIVVSGHENVELPHEMAHAVKVEKV
jgi:DtxR family Mn-dependent transcriptional regulator